MRLFRLHPEVAGGWGPRTTVTNQDAIEAGRATVPLVAVLEYRFEGWLGDELLESFPCFILTDRLANAIHTESLSGAGWGEVLISMSEDFTERHPGVRLPSFKRLLPEGRVTLGGAGEVTSWSGHDFCVADRAELVVTERGLDLLRRHGLKHCEAAELKVES
jgi:hypothetical protein